MKMNNTLYLFISLFLLTSCFDNKHDYKEKFNLSPDYYLIAGCSIYDQDFKLIKTLSSASTYCLALEDGTWLANGEGNVTYYSNTGTIIWKKYGNYHHYAIIDSEQNFLVMGSEFKKNNNLTIRLDTIEKISKTGLILNTFKLSENIDQLDKMKNTSVYKNYYPFFLLPILPASPIIASFDLELSHFNSIYETKAGFLINDPYLGICFFIDKNLKLTGKKFDINKIKYNFPLLSKKYKKYDPFISHDCQLLEDNSIIYYSSSYKLNDKRSFAVFKSNGDQFDVIYPHDASQVLVAGVGGSVQLINNHLVVLIMDTFHSYVDIVDPSGITQKRVKLNSFALEAKFINLKKFLINNKQ